VSWLNSTWFPNDSHEIVELGAFAYRQAYCSRIVVVVSMNVVQLEASEAPRDARLPHCAVASERLRGGHQRSSVGLGLRIHPTRGTKMTDDMMNLRALMERART
jgi:hypothetical protein